LDEKFLFFWYSKIRYNDHKGLHHDYILDLLNLLKLMCVSSLQPINMFAIVIPVS